MSKNKHTNTIENVTVPTHRPFLFYPDFFLPLLILLLGTVFFWFSDIDMQIQRFFYHADSGWWLAEHSLVQFIYHYGNIPALLLVFGAIILLGLSYGSAKYVKWRKIGLFIVLCLAIGPGLIVNTVLKDNWGRPRPRNLSEFGGKYQYEKILSIDPESDGKSFPCGHATMGYFLFVPWFVFRASTVRKRKFAIAFLWIGIVYGIGIGIVRIIQGGHFASDVLWAGPVVYLSAAFIFYLLQMHKDVYFHTKGESKQNKAHKYRFLLWLLIPLVAGLALLATPYSRLETKDLTATQSDSLMLNLDYGDLYIAAKSEIEKSQVLMQANGFAFPGSKIKLKDGSDPFRMVQSFTQSKKGVFTELNLRTYLIADPAKPLAVHATLSDGDITADLKLFTALNSFSFHQIGGTLQLSLPKNFSQPIYIIGEADLKNKRQELNLVRVSSVVPDSVAFRISMERGILIIR